MTRHSTAQHRSNSGLIALAALVVAALPLPLFLCFTVLIKMLAS